MPTKKKSQTPAPADPAEAKLKDAAKQMAEKIYAKAKLVGERNRPLILKEITSLITTKYYPGFPEELIPNLLMCLISPYGSDELMIRAELQQMERSIAWLDTINGEQ